LPDAVLLVLIFAIVILLMFVGFVILVVMVYRKKQMVFIKEKLLQEIEYRNQILEKELEIQKKIQEERERISHDMHDDLGAGISALKLQAEFLKQKINEQHLKEDINDLLKTSEEMNLSMREMLWSLNSNNDTLGNFIQYLTIYSENFFKKTEIEIKIDRTFVQALPDDKHSRELCRTIVSLADSLGMAVTAEGIETQPQRQFLQSLRCEEGQGYLFSHPLSEPRMTSMLTPQR
jgi:two-component system sensor histidine kinase DesK